MIVQIQHIALIATVSVALVTAVSTSVIQVSLPKKVAVVEVGFITSPGLTPVLENFTGANATGGTDGQKNRVITLSNTSLSRGTLVFEDERFLHPITRVTINNLVSHSTITFLDELFDISSITVVYNV